MTIPEAIRDSLQTAEWFPRSMISDLLEMLVGMLSTAILQSTKLEQAKHQLHTLDNAAITQIIADTSGKQRQMIPLHLEQCHRWQKEQLDHRQLSMVKEIEEVLEQFDKTLVNIHSLACEIRKNVLDKALQIEWKNSIEAYIRKQNQEQSCFEYCLTPKEASLEKSQYVYELTHDEARKYFLQEKHYCTLNLPPYFKFEPLLRAIDKTLRGKELKTFCAQEKKPRNYATINYVITDNKDGQYAWRAFQLIHPALYVSLVQKITQEENWRHIQNKFKEFHDTENIKCFSHPIKSESLESSKEKQIKRWLEKVEMQSIELALDYEYLTQIDIADCYSSIYTHSISWALHTKEVAKKNAQNKKGKNDTNGNKLIGDEIDSHIQDMSHGQTNGIPQGSELMNFIAEMVLGYADTDLGGGIAETEINDYKIIRYRDDYRIFTHTSQEGRQITKCLAEILRDMGLKINPKKTKESAHLIRDSIKEDKLYWGRQNINKKGLLKHLLIIQQLAERYQNSGSLIKALKSYLEKIEKLTDISRGDINKLISITVDIALKNPRAYPLAVAIVSEFMKFTDDKKEVLDKIIKKFKNIPNTAFLEIWLQRLLLALELDFHTENKLCKFVVQQIAKKEPSEENTIDIWEHAWINPSPKSTLRRCFKNNSVVDRNEIDKLPLTIKSTEVTIFNYIEND